MSGQRNSDFDALLVLSFGGPEKPDDVMPFLENVTRGRGVPPERLAAVAEHYMHFGGVSPINALNRDIIARLEAELREGGIDLPVYFGNRNWHPMVEDTVARMRDDGVRNALVFPTSACGAATPVSSVRRGHRAGPGRSGPPTHRAWRSCGSTTTTRSWFAAFADAIHAAREQLSEDARDRARLVFTAHSVPLAADENAGPPAEGGNLYSRQVADASRLCAEAAGIDDFDLVWQSRAPVRRRCRGSTPTSAITSTRLRRRARPR